MDNFDLKKFLIENKLTKSSQLDEVQTLADVNREELGTLYTDSKKWKGKKLKVLDGEFTKKHPEYKNAIVTFVFFDSRENLVGVDFEDGKSGSLYPKELGI